MRSIRRADAVICISLATRQDVLRYAPDVDPSRVHVVHLGIDTSDFYPDTGREDPQLENMVLYVGKRVPSKRFDLAIKSVAQCHDLVLGIVGPALNEDEIRMLSSLLPGRWRLFGPVAGARLRELYSAAFAYVCPSEYEGFGLPVLEAMACGCPVVAARTTSLPEVGGAAALYAHEQSPEMYAEPLAQLQDSARRTKVIEAGLAHVKDFAWERTFDKTLAIYLGQEAIDERD
jgi:mannosyltransferase